MKSEHQTNDVIENNNSMSDNIRCEDTKVNISAIEHGKVEIQEEKAKRQQNEKEKVNSIGKNENEQVDVKSIIEKDKLTQQTSTIQESISQLSNVSQDGKNSNTKNGNLTTDQNAKLQMNDDQQHNRIRHDDDDDDDRKEEKKFSDKKEKSHDVDVDDAKLNIRKEGDDFASASKKTDDRIEMNRNDKSMNDSLTNTNQNQHQDQHEHELMRRSQVVDDSNKKNDMKIHEKNSNSKKNTSFSRANDGNISTNSIGMI